MRLPLGLALLLLACGSPPAAETVTVSPSDAGGVPANEPSPTKPNQTTMLGGPQSCNRDTDCEVVETKCCDHCNGGQVQAFNALVADQYRPQCEATVCTRRGCSPASASCVNRHCVINPP